MDSEGAVCGLSVKKSLSSRAERDRPKDDLRSRGIPTL